MNNNSANQKKYDRQLRIWGVEGQTRLMQSNVCLLNAGPTGTETLKNLVLPGIGSFTIVDPHLVSEWDCTNNFFVSKNHVGKPRAEYCRDLLCELNADVKGTAYCRDPVELIQKDLGFFLPFSLVVATQIDEFNLIALGSVCEKLNLPLVVCRTFGLMGHCRVYAKQHSCYNIDPFPKPDLRMHKPFSALLDLAKDAMEKEQLSHIPYVLLLTHLWQHVSKESAAPDLKSTLMKRIHELGEEDNVLEGAKFAYLAHKPFELPPNIADLFQDKECLNVGPTSHTFWILVRALKAFYDSTGELPLKGTLPDMTSSTALFVKVQDVYSEQSKRDFAEFSRLVDQVLLDVKCTREISLEERSMFCKFASSHLCVRFRPLHEEFASPLTDNWFVNEGVMSPVLFYLVWRQCDEWFLRTGQYPGSVVSMSESELQACAEELLARVRNVVHTRYPVLVPHEELLGPICQEMVRYGGVEMHNIAAIVGGIGAQEAVKLITHQYEPLNHTYFYNGIVGVGENWSF